MKYKVDLHTHSVWSQDGGISEHEYEQIITKRILDVVAITDHNRIDFAQKMQEKFGQRVIVGEEITTKSGEVIGLFLKEKIAPKQSLGKTIEKIHAQGGLVYMPHPFDRLRHGIGKKNLLKHREEIDVVEGFNARVFWPGFNTKAREFGVLYKIVRGIGSDAHGRVGIGKCFAVVNEPFIKANAKKLLSQATFAEQYQPWVGYLLPKLHRIGKLFKKHA